jgi:Concanavalin A-like lectin/glucanases superfamily
MAIAIAVAAIGLLAGAFVAGAATTDPLVGEWHMDALNVAGEGVWSTPDSSGAGLDLSGNVPPSALVPGKWGNAVDFSAASFDELSTTQPEPQLEPAQVTVMGWVKAASSPGPNAYIIAQGGGPACTPSSYALTTGGDGGLQFDVSDGASVSPSADPGPRVWDGSWHFVVGTYDGTTVRLFVDGNEVTPSTASNTVINYQLPTNRFALGGYPDPNCRQFAFYTGALDEARVYDRALTAAEIEQLQQGSTGDMPPELGGTTTTSTTPTTPGSPHPVAKFVVAGGSATLKGATWFNGATSIAAAGAPIVSYAWDPTGSGDYSDPCGSAPIASLMFASRGIHTVGLQVTDSTGAVSTYRQTILVTGSMVSKVLGARYTYDCENPAGGGDQPSTADCIKTFAWSIIDVNSRGGSDDCFKITSSLNRVVLPATARAARILGTIPRSYHATVTGPVAVNGLYVPVPHAVTTVYDTRDGTIGLGRVPLRIGPFGTQTLDLNLHVALQSIPVSDCYSHPTEGFRLVDSGTVNTGDSKIAGLPVQGGVGVDLLDHSSRVTLHVGLPNIFGFAPGNPAQGTLCLNLDNTNGLSIDGAKIGPIPNAFVGPIALQNLTFHYVADDNLWEGGATVTLPGSLYGLDASPPPPDLGFGIKNGNFDHAGIGVDFPPAGQPELFPGVFLTNIHVALGTDPLRFTGGVGLTAAQIFSINGDVFVAFASPDQPYSFPSTGGDLAPLSGRTLSSFTIAVGGNASAKLPVLGGQLPLANAYLLYEFPDYFELGGGFEFDPPLLKITGSMLGFLDPSNHSFNLQGNVSACLRNVQVSVLGQNLDINPCYTTAAAVSSKGVGFCGTLPVPVPVVGVVPVQITVGYKWGDALPSITPGFSCSMGDYEVTSAHAARAAGPSGFSLPRGLTATTVRVTGSGGAPDVVLTGPHGIQVSTVGATARSDVVVIHLPDADQTLVGLRRPAGGRWVVSPVPGSAPVAGVAVAHSLPAPDVRASVTGRGARRTLSYRLAAAPGRVVTFVERGAAAYRTLGVARGSHGRIAFSPAAGPGGRREILALISQGGAPAGQTVVGSYRAPAQTRLPAPRGLHARRAGSRLVVSADEVPDAWRYATTLTLASGRRELLLSRGPRVSFAAVDPAFGGRVQVVAIAADGSRGRTASASFTAPRPGRPRRR